ncbi:ribosomal RNA large subunit methyltransferase J [Necator americanus]|uniref:Putative rRNA methyltransferase n=1 Tax=Necator americanus TaxID=51031 RepID=W2TQJ2_NECAM|nr:ribosomal RNA large subunit methyltransferase J [Necator americanus]ETN84325.1 ribosomal RNA large subunit methyltransferase J [Necator americanus]
MGKKVKIGKQRRDKYYKLAKEAGYRSRAAFKLIQLNKRFEFLQNSRATVDLCAAPGGWMQVATQNMPVSSLVIGVDLVPIKPIANCIALQGDITTEKTRQAIKKELQRWEADCVLHDGAPNVGLNWVHDAFQQNCLVLSALKLATQILRKNGTFVTKVFRSNDYSCLITVFEKLFKKVHVWKPAASRLESAEIFVVCEKYLKPPKVAPELLDHKKVFLEPDGHDAHKPNPQTILLGKKEKKAKAEGYEEGLLSVHKKVDATTFIQAHEYLEVLGGANEIVLDQEKWKNAPETNEEIREYLKDLKVCGPRELRKLLKWRKAMRSILEEELKALEKELGEENAPEVELNEDELEDKEMAEIDEMIARATEEERVALKKRKKKLLKAKAKIVRRRQLKMIIEGDHADQVEDIELFSLKKIRRARELNKLTADSVETPEIEGMNEDQEGLGDGEWETRDGTGSDDEEENDDEVAEESSDESDNELINTEESGLIVAQHRVNYSSIFSMHKLLQEEIAGLLSDEDEDDEMDVIEKHMKRQSRNLHANTVSFEDDEMSNKKRRKRKNSDDGDVDVDGEHVKANEDEVEEGSKFTAEMAWEEEEFEDEDNRAAKREVSKAILGEDLKPSWFFYSISVSIQFYFYSNKAKKRRLTPEQLALGEQLIYSSKSAREVEEYANNDEGLPDWFVEDERKHYRKQLPVSKAQVEEYRKRLRELNARPCKKVAEAKTRKQRRALRRLQAAKKKAEGVLENENLEHAEKVREMKKIYAAANKKERKKTELVVMTKGKKGKISRPNGRYKLVDSRMKKDLRAMKSKEKTKGRGKRSHSGRGRR